MRPFALLAFSILLLRAQAQDLYPEIHALVSEAESAAANIRLLEDRSDPHAWAGRIYARAGYLDDAERAFAASPGSSGGPPYPLWRAWVVYGHIDRAEKSFESVADPDKRAGLLAALADLLWRMGQPAQARLHFTSARQFAADVVNPARRKQLLASIDQGLTFVSEPPPDLISPMPHPRPRLKLEGSPIPSFPVTADGFDDTTPNGKAARAAANEAFLTRVYDRIAARDGDGLQRLTEGASTPFQRVLGIAAMEHLLILTYQPKPAEAFAKSIPEVDSASSLAKAEALTAVASAWLRALDDNRARADFGAAVRIALAVHAPPFGRISVLVPIAAAQYKAGFMEDSSATFHAAIALAQDLPQRPKPLGVTNFTQTGIRYNLQPAGVHYKDEGFEKILRAAIRAQDIDVARDLTAIWRETDGHADVAVVNAWLAADHPQEAVASARMVKSPQLKVGALLNLAQTLLDDAGAPSF